MSRDLRFTGGLVGDEFMVLHFVELMVTFHVQSMSCEREFIH